MRFYAYQILRKSSYSFKKWKGNIDDSQIIQGFSCHNIYKNNIAKINACFVECLNEVYKIGVIDRLMKLYFIDRIYSALGVILIILIMIPIIIKLQHLNIILDFRYLKVLMEYNGVSQPPYLI